MSLRILRRTTLITLAAVALSSLGGCPTGSDGDGGEDGVTVVLIRDLAFSPKSVTIKVGETVRWVNRDIVVHTVTSGNPGDADAGALFDSGDISFNGEFERTFDAAGTFTYFCIPHQEMAAMRDATVIVEP